MILLLVERPGGGGTFIADELVRDGGTWTARGSWKYGSGRLGNPARYSWPVDAVREIRWDWDPGHEPDRGLGT